MMLGDATTELRWQFTYYIRPAGLAAGPACGSPCDADPAGGRCSKIPLM